MREFSCLPDMPPKIDCEPAGSLTNALLPVPVPFLLSLTLSRCGDNRAVRSDFFGEAIYRISDLHTARSSQRDRGELNGAGAPIIGPCQPHRAPVHHSCNLSDS